MHLFQSLLSISKEPSIFQGFSTLLMLQTTYEDTVNYEFVMSWKCILKQGRLLVHI